MAQPFPSRSPVPDRQPLAPSPSTPSRSLTNPPNRHDHPYLIRTTSSSLLTRSNSIGSVQKPQIHISYSNSSPALGRAQGRGHKKTKSQTSLPPLPPLPLPLASPTSPEASRSSGAPLTPAPLTDDETNSVNGDGTPNRPKRSSTVSSTSSETSLRVEGLPHNPKAWTSTHLSSYLSSALRVKGGGSLPGPVIRDVATFVVNQKLNGRTFLRLTPETLEEMGMNQLWRPSILNASRVLRQNVVHGRIWGFGSSNEDNSLPPNSSTTAPSNNNRTSLPSVPSTVFEDHQDDTPARSIPGQKCQTSGLTAGSMFLQRSNSGKVKNLVANFERSASSSSASENSAEELISPIPFEPESPAQIDGPLLPEFSGALAPIQSPVSSDDGDDAGFASGELTSDSEVEDVRDEEVGIRVTTEVGVDHDTIPEEDEALLEPRERGAAVVDTESDVSPTPSSILPRTPPPIYAADAPEVAGGPDDDVTPEAPSKSSHSRSGSATFILTSRRSPSWIAHIGKDSGSDDTIENLISNFNTAEPLPPPLTGSWGANAWLEETPVGSTAKKIHEPISISRRGNRSMLQREAEPARPSVVGLFEPQPFEQATETTPPRSAKSDVAVDATSSPMEEKADACLLAALQEKQAQQQLIIEEFNRRLEEVEKRLEEMEAKERDRVTSQSGPEVSDTTVVEEEPIAVFSAGVAADLQKKASRSPPVHEEEEDEEDDGYQWEDPSPAGLPSYVFLVGLGVAAVVMRVMIRKVAGKSNTGKSIMGLL